MHRWFKRATCVMALVCCSLHGQNGPSAPAFEVATIRIAPPITPAMVAAGNMHTGMKVDKGRVDIGFTSLAELMTMAYQVKSYQISGPDWMRFDRWDILAKIPEGATPSDVPQMLQKLLAERFRLTVHRENRERRVYALEPAKTGLNLKESPADETMPTPPVADGEQAGPGADKPLQIKTSNDGMSTVTSGGRFGRTTTEMRPDGSMRLDSSRMTIPMLAEALSFYLDRPVIDLTQLAGSYRMELEFAAADLRYAAMKTGLSPGRRGRGSVPNRGACIRPGYRHLSHCLNTPARTHAGATASADRNDCGGPPGENSNRKLSAGRGYSPTLRPGLPACRKIFSRRPTAR